ncbi:39S ribosomal protein L32, mitochondrial [Drosophila sechellia]|uniref:Large ribosomal subunit protein bL32m n=1 Tax=Drosophila sechellia TaxID=7238 RepID=B4I008_DROSE|nr:39S ribosomal protein L32, mitochondrial [Drosophila sechellia]EDW53615.1 GM12928 [Drosophila sechellia]
MSRNLFLSITNFIRNLENLFLPHGGHPPALALAGFQHDHSPKSSTEFSLKQLIGDGMLWAVPKHRRSVEKRLKRKFGHPEYNWKPLREKRNLRSCLQCGHDHEMGVLCPFCYQKVLKETELMQSKIQETLGLDPVDKEVIVLYEGEKAEQSTDDLKNKRIVEMKKPRPMWFTKNLLQKSTQQLSETKEVKPSDLA